MFKKNKLEQERNFVSEKKKSFNRVLSGGKVKSEIDSQSDLFASEVSNGRTQPSRSCMNGKSEGFYKQNSPKRDSSSSPPSVMSSPKASVRGKWKCSTCKQSFRSCELLITHIEDFHNKQTTKCACIQCKMYMKDEFSFKVHKKQHEIDRKKGKK